MSARADAVFWLGEEQGVTVDVQDHFSGGVANGRVRVSGGIVEQPQGFVVFFSVTWDWFAGMELRAMRMVALTAIT